MSLCVRKPTLWVPTRSDTNRSEQSQKMARGLCRRGIVLFVSAKTKALNSCAVTAQLICVFVFAYADCWFCSYSFCNHDIVQNALTDNVQTVLRSTAAAAFQ